MANAFLDNVYRGLNVAKGLSDIDDPSIALANIGLKKANLDLMRGLSDYIGRAELHNLSGLVDDQKRMLQSLESSSNAAVLITAGMRNVSADQLFNFSINSKLIAGSIKYSYINFEGSGGTAWELKSADISTSRVSSWSPFGPVDNPDEIITYNSEVLSTGEYLAMTELGLTSEPQTKKYLAQVPTDTLTLNINGANVKLPVMRGIPFNFLFNSESIEFDMDFVEPLLSVGSQVVYPSFEKTDIDVEPQIKIAPLLSSTGSEFFINETTSNAYTGNAGSYYWRLIADLPSNANRALVDVFYNPARIRRLRMRSNGLADWPNTVFPALEELQIGYNEFTVVPDFNFSTPNLKKLVIQSNDLWAGVQEASNYENFDGSPQAQLERMPLSLQELDDRDCWRGLNEVLNVDYSRFPNMARAAQGLTGYRIPSSEKPEGVNGGAPPYYDSNYKVDLDPTSSDLNASTGVFTFTNHRFTSGDKVRYKNRVAADDLFSKSNYFGTLCEELSPLSRNQILEVTAVSGNTFKLKTYPGGSVINSYTLSADTGIFHTLEKWDTTTDNLHIEPDTGIDSYEPNLTRYTYVPVSYCNSSRFKKLGGSRECVMHAISEYRYIDFTNANTLAISNEDREFYVMNRDGQFNTESGSGIYANDGYERFKISEQSFMNFPNLSGFPNFNQCLYYNNMPDQFWSDAQASIDASKFVNMPKLRTIWVYGNSWRSSHQNSRILTGDMTDGFKNMDNAENPNKSPYIQFYANKGIKFRIDDNTFSGTDKVGILKLGDNSRPANNYGDVRLCTAGYTLDFFAIDQTTNRTGTFLGPRTKMDEFTVKELSTPGRLYNDDVSPPVDAVGIKQMNGGAGGRAFNLINANIFGKVPPINSPRAYYISYTFLGNVNHDGNSIAPFQAVPGEPNRIYFTPNDARSTSEYLGELDPAVHQYYKGQGTDVNPTAKGHGIRGVTGYSISQQEWVDMGWTNSNQDSTYVSWGDSSGTRTGNPKGGDWFNFRHPSVNECIEGAEFVITELGTTSKSEWIDLGWVANDPDFDTTNDPKVGDIFIASNNANRINLASVVGGETYHVMKGGNASGMNDMVGMGGISSLLYAQWGGESSPNVFATSTGINGSESQRGYGTYLMKVSGVTSSYRDFGTGKVARNRVKQAMRYRGPSGFVTDSQGRLTNMNSLAYFNCYNTFMDGDFPIISQDINTNTGRRSLFRFHLYNNKFTGPVPDLRGINTAQEYKMYNNRFDSYTTGSFSTLTATTKKIELQNNRLSAAAGRAIIDDLYTAWTASGKSITLSTLNLTGQQPVSGAGINKQDLGTVGTNSSRDRLDTLENEGGWSISIQTTP